MRKVFISAACVVTVLATSLAFVSATTNAPQFEKLAQIRQDLVEVKAELGMYSCCIAPSCNFCALATGMCPCGDRARQGEGVCGECLLGWHAGQGSIAGINAEDVTGMEGRILDMMYRQRAQATPGKETAHSHRHDAAHAGGR